MTYRQRQSDPLVDRTLWHPFRTRGGLAGPRNRQLDHIARRTPVDHRRYWQVPHDHRERISSFLQRTPEYNK